MPKQQQLKIIQQLQLSQATHKTKQKKKKTEKKNNYEKNKSGTKNSSNATTTTEENDITSNTTNVADETQQKKSNNIENNQQNTGKALSTMTETPLFDFLPKKSSTEKNQHTAEISGKKANFTH